MSCAPPAAAVHTTSGRAPVSSGPGGLDETVTNERDELSVGVLRTEREISQQGTPAQADRQYARRSQTRKHSRTGSPHGSTGADNLIVTDTGNETHTPDDRSTVADHKPPECQTTAERHGGAGGQALSYRRHRQ